MMAIPSAINDGSAAPPRLRLDLATCCVASLPFDSSFTHEPETAAWFAAIRAAGFSGLVGCDAALAQRHGFETTAGGRVNLPNEVEPLAAQAAAVGHQAVTLHVGWGFESDAEMDALADAILAASERHHLPIFVETHRATMTQDQWRTLRLLERHPDLAFTGDLSHWYTGQELRYGGAPLGPRLDRIAAVFARIGMLHGRIGTGGCMQVPVDPERDRDQHWFQHYRLMWTRVFRAFRARAVPGDILVVAPELLPAGNGYAREIPGPDGVLREESDRWQQAQVIADLARKWWDESDE